MDTKRPVTLKVAAILLLILTVINAAAVIAQQYGWRMPAGVMQSTRLSQPDRGWDEAQPRDDQRPQNRPNFPQTRIFRPDNAQDVPAISQRPLFSLWLRMERLLRFWGSLALLALATLAAVGVWKGKGWGTALAIILAALILLTTLFAVFPMRSLRLVWMVSRMGQAWWPLVTFGINLLKALLALTIIILLLLPASRQTYRASPSS